MDRYVLQAATKQRHKWQGPILTVHCRSQPASFGSICQKKKNSSTGYPPLPYFLILLPHLPLSIGCYNLVSRFIFDPIPFRYIPIGLHWKVKGVDRRKQASVTNFPRWAKKKFVSAPRRPSFKRFWSSEGAVLTLTADLSEQLVDLFYEKTDAKRELRCQLFGAHPFLSFYACVVRIVRNPTAYRNEPKPRAEVHSSPGHRILFTWVIPA